MLLPRNWCPLFHAVVNPENDRVDGLLEDFRKQLSSSQSVHQHKKQRFPGESKLTDVTSRLGKAAVELPFELKALEICFDKVCLA